MTKITIIEDEPSILRLYKTKLSLAGYQVTTAQDGLEGLAVIQREQPELILLDLRMPRLSGDEMLARLRAEEWGASAVVIVLTNLSRSEAPAALNFLGVARYIIKAHYTPRQVVEIVQEVLREYGLQ